MFYGMHVISGHGVYQQITVRWFERGYLYSEGYGNIFSDSTQVIVDDRRSTLCREVPWEISLLLLTL